MPARRAEASERCAVNRLGAQHCTLGRAFVTSNDAIADLSVLIRAAIGAQRLQEAFWHCTWSGRCASIEHTRQIMEAARGPRVQAEYGRVKGPGRAA